MMFRNNDYKSLKKNKGRLTGMINQLTKGDIR